MKRPTSSGFTLLEVMIAMSILALGATSILSVFVAAVSFQTQRVEDNRLTEEKPIPPKIVVDLTDAATAETSTDPMIREASEKFPGFRYEILFEEDQFSVAGSSVVAHIRIFRLSGQLDESELVDKEFLTRNGVPFHEFYKLQGIAGVSQAERDADVRRKDPKRPK
jgi:prepilin-type N-terminal cleavage/methylation domain-containing protein